jgi:hypothetical protein
MLKAAAVSSFMPSGTGITRLSPITISSAKEP